MNRVHFFYAAVLLIVAGMSALRTNGQPTQPPPPAAGRYTMWAEAADPAGQVATVFVLDTNNGTVWMRDARSARVTTFFEVPRE